MQKRADAAKDADVIVYTKTKNREKTRKSVVKYVLTLAAVVLLIVLLSLAMRIRNDNEKPVNAPDTYPRQEEAYNAVYTSGTAQIQVK